MSDFIPTAGVPISTSAGHLTVHLDESRASDVPFLFEQQLKKERFGGAVSGSVFAHVAFFAFIVLMAKVAPTPTIATLNDFTANKEIVWLENRGRAAAAVAVAIACRSLHARRSCRAKTRSPFRSRKRSI
jgi:hypothetical protein